MSTELSSSCLCSLGEQFKHCVWEGRSKCCYLNRPSVSVLNPGPQFCCRLGSSDSGSNVSTIPFPTVFWGVVWLVCLPETCWESAFGQKPHLSLLSQVYTCAGVYPVSNLSSCPVHQNEREQLWHSYLIDLFLNLKKYQSNRAVLQKCF